MVGHHWQLVSHEGSDWPSGYSGAKTPNTIHHDKVIRPRIVFSSLPTIINCRKWPTKLKSTYIKYLNIYSNSLLYTKERMLLANETKMLGLA